MNFLFRINLNSVIFTIDMSLQSLESRLQILEADKQASKSPDQIIISQDINNNDYVFIHNKTTNRTERVIKSLFVSSLNDVPTDETLFYDDDGLLRSNVSDFEQSFTWNTGDSTIFELAFTPTHVLNVFLGGQKLNNSQFNYILPNSIEVTEPMLDGNIIQINYQHYINTPE